MPKKQFSIRLDEEIYKRLDNFHWESRKSLNDLITEAVERYLDAQEKDKKTV